MHAWNEYGEKKPMNEMSAVSVFVVDGYLFVVVVVVTMFTSCFVDDIIGNLVNIYNQPEKK